VCEGLNVTILPVFLGLLVGLLALQKGFLGHDLTLAMRTDCYQLASKLNVFEVEELIVLHATVKVIIISLILL
jgi:hypothetical protein